MFRWRKRRCDGCWKKRRRFLYATIGQRKYEICIRCGERWLKDYIINRAGVAAKYKQANRSSRT